MGNYVITIARGFGSGGKTVGQMLSKDLQIAYYDKDLIHMASEASGINVQLFGKVDEKVKPSLFKRLHGNRRKEVLSPEDDAFVSDENLFNYQAMVIKSLADKQSCVIVGRCADYVLAGRKNVMRVFVYAEHDACVKNIMEKYGWDAKRAEREIERIDKERSAYYRYYTGHNWDNARNYDLCLNSSELGYEKCVQIMKDYLQIRGLSG